MGENTSGGDSSSLMLSCSIQSLIDTHGTKPVRHSVFRNHVSCRARIRDAGAHVSLGTRDSGDICAATRENHGKDDNRNWDTHWVLAADDFRSTRIAFWGSTTRKDRVILGVAAQPKLRARGGRFSAGVTAGLKRASSLSRVGAGEDGAGIQKSPAANSMEQIRARLTALFSRPPSTYSAAHRNYNGIRIRSGREPRCR